MSGMVKKNIPKIIAIAVTALVVLLGVFLIGYQVMKEKDSFGEIELSENTKTRIKNAKESNQPTIIISNVESKAKGTALVTVSLVNNPGIIGLSATLSYDETVMELEDIKNGDVFGSPFHMESSENLSSGCNFIWDATDVSEEEVKDGIVLALKFRIKKDAPAGKTPVIMICDYEGILGKDLNVINMNVDQGYITVGS